MKDTWRILWIGTVLLLLTVTATAQNKPLPKGGTSLVPAIGKMQVVGDVAVTTVPANLPNRTEALRVETRKVPANFWDAQVRFLNSAPVQKGDILLATFYARRISGGNVESGEGTLGFVFEENQSPYDKSVEISASVPNEWQRYDIPFVATKEYPANGAGINFRVGFLKQIIEIAGITVTNYAKAVRKEDLPYLKLTYAGREATAAWRKAANERIEKIRKGTLTVQVTDTNGKPVSGATVSVSMVRHAFPFGSAVDSERLLGKDADSEKYRQFITQNFNRVVLENDLKWPGWESRPQTALNGLKWMHDHHIAVRGHNLVWPSWQWSPQDIPKLANDKAALAKRVDTHFKDIITATKGQLVEWDVVNEPFANHNIQDILGADTLGHWFRLAKSLDAKPTLFLNDYPPLDGEALADKHLQFVEDTVIGLQRQKVPIGGIGFQCHFGNSVVPPARIVSGLDRFGKLGLPIAVTEFDIKTDDEAMQADYMRDFMTAAFSHPACNSIIMWGFWEGQHWIPSAALIRRDWTVRPVGTAWLHQVKQVWWTKASGQTNQMGNFETRAFYGDYVITVTKGKKVMTLEYGFPTSRKSQKVKVAL